jgi:hypothetical protein
MFGAWSKKDAWIWSRQFLPTGVLNRGIPDAQRAMGGVSKDQVDQRKSIQMDPDDASRELFARRLVYDLAWIRIYLRAVASVPDAALLRFERNCAC